MWYLQRHRHRCAVTHWRKHKFEEFATLSWPLVGYDKIPTERAKLSSKRVSLLPVIGDAHLSHTRLLRFEEKDGTNSLGEKLIRKLIRILITFLPLSEIIPRTVGVLFI